MLLNSRHNHKFLLPSEGTVFQFNQMTIFTFTSFSAENYTKTILTFLHTKGFTCYKSFRSYYVLKFYLYTVQLFFWGGSVLF